MFTIAAACAVVMLAVAVAAQIEPSRSARLAPAPEQPSARAALPHSQADSAVARRGASPSRVGT
ncbi:MAG: hypothetical protein HZC37_12815 [Burkholderiales bacterium]|nr:hypothetical protein [Burkholderiales bacterium]